MSRNEKIFIIFITILFIGLGIFAYFWFNSSSITPGKIPGGDGFQPFGTGGGDITPSPEAIPTDTTGIDTGVDSARPPRLRKISHVPTTGYVLFPNKQAEQAIRYMERGNGNIFEITGTTSVVYTRLTNTTIPRVYETLFSPDGQRAITRYEDETTGSITSFLGTIFVPKASSSTEPLIGSFEGSFLPTQALQAVWGPKNDLFLLTETRTGSKGTLYPADVKIKPRDIFTSPFTEWLIEWPASTGLSLITKAANGEMGYAYRLRADTGLFEPTIDGVSGLTARVSNDEKKILMGRADDTDITLALYDVIADKTTIVPFKTFPEKCVWSNTNIVIYCAVPHLLPDLRYPDAWYRGEVSFQDDIWKYDTKTGEAKILYDSTGKEKVSGGLDMVNPSLSPGEKYLYFMDKKDPYVWAYRLEE